MINVGRRLIIDFAPLPDGAYDCPAILAAATVPLFLTMAQRIQSNRDAIQ